MSKVTWASTLLWSLVGLTAFTQAQQPRSHRLVIIAAEKLRHTPPQITGLRDGLKKQGFTEGNNLRIDLLQEETYERLDSSLKKFISQHRIEVIVVLSEADTVVASNITDKIPIVFLPAADPVRAGLVKSLAHPGTNLTGLTYMDVNIRGKQLELFKEVVPSLREVIALSDSQKENPTSASSLLLVRSVAKHLQIALTEKPVTSLTEAEHLVSALPKNTSAGVFPICTGLFRRLKTLASLSIERRLPLFGCAARGVAEEDVLLSYAPDLYYIGTRGAWYVNRILKGARPHDLPIETPRKAELAINLKTATSIGLQIPPEVLQRADKVIR
jgi:putative tryptophan/tyrosine transport system substrate-binding protein